MDLLDVGNIALEQGLSPEAAMAAMAIAKTEGGLTGAVGDNGQSYGPFQFYSGGQLKNFAKTLGVPLVQAGQIARSKPDVAVRWALRQGGYLGDMLRKGEAAGIKGADLATYAQRHGQVSVSPDRAGQNFQSMWGDYSPTRQQPQQPARMPQAPPGGWPTRGGTPARMPQAPPGGWPVNTPGAKPATMPQWGGVQAAARPSQFKMTEDSKLLSPNEAYAFCGPTAAMAFAASYGRMPSLGEAKQLASSVGWSPARGMAGPGSTEKMIDAMGVPSSFEAWGSTSPNWSRVQQTVGKGHPVILSTPGHYFYATGYDPQRDAYNVGTSGTDLRGGSDWMTPQQMSARMGPFQGAIFADIAGF